MFLLCISDCFEGQKSEYIQFCEYCLFSFVSLITSEKENSDKDIPENIMKYIFMSIYVSSYFSRLYYKVFFNKTKNFLNGKKSFF